MNSYVRFKLALTENEPTIRPYDEALWANLRDSRDTAGRNFSHATRSPSPSLGRIVALVALGRLLRASCGIHSKETMTLDDMVGHYAWHGRHHVAHITSLRDREGWK